MSLFITLLLAFGVFVVAAAAMSVGVMAGRAPIRGSCGGLNGGGCELCGGNGCEREGRR